MYRQRGGGSKTRKILLIVLALLFVAFVALLAALAVREQRNEQSAADSSGTATQEPEPRAEPEKPAPVDLQPVVEQWLEGQSADFGIVVYDADNQKTIASHQPDQSYFAASLYKLFVAYLALEDFQTDAQNPDEVLTQGFTRSECIDKMIRESHSPCGEAMMAEMGPASLQSRLREMGIQNTTFPGITTTAGDSALILEYIQKMRDLNQANTGFLKDAMRVQEQRFRNGLAKGAPEATWETKVGWNEDQNYHDVGIMTMPDGRIFTVAILSQNNGSSEPIANFAATIYSALRQD